MIEHRTEPEKEVLTIRFSLSWRILQPKSEIVCTVKYSNIETMSHKLVKNKLDCLMNILMQDPSTKCIVKIFNCTCQNEKRTSI